MGGALSMLLLSCCSAARLAAAVMAAAVAVAVMAAVMAAAAVARWSWRRQEWGQRICLGSMATKKPCIEVSALEGPLKAQPVGHQEHVVVLLRGGTQGCTAAHIRPESSARERAQNEGER